MAKSSGQSLQISLLTLARLARLDGARRHNLHTKLARASLLVFLCIFVRINNAHTSISRPALAPTPANLPLHLPATALLVSRSDDLTGNLRICREGGGREHLRYPASSPTWLPCSQVAMGFSVPLFPSRPSPWPTHNHRVRRYHQHTSSLLHFRHVAIVRVLNFSATLLDPEATKRLWDQSKAIAM